MDYGTVAMSVLCILNIVSEVRGYGERNVKLKAPTETDLLSDLSGCGGETEVLIGAETDRSKLHVSTRSQSLTALCLPHFNLEVQLFQTFTLVC